MGRHVKRASRQKIAWFRKRLGPLIEERMRASYTACVQDEAICVADARLRKGIYTYTGSHSKTVVFGLITLDGEGFFQRYGSFTGKEFVEFLKAACERFGKILMITDGAPQHRSKFVREEIGRLGGVELQFLLPGCPDLNAIYSADHKFVQNIDQHLLESITTSQKKSVFHEGFDSISGFLSVSEPYGLLTHCTNFCVSL